MSREHATEVLEALAEPGCLFTAAQREEMHKVLTSLVQAPRVSPKEQKKYATQQDNSHLEEYMPDELWSKLFDKTVALRDKWQLWADFLTNVLGCRNPNELTRVRAVAITHVASGMQVAPEVARAHVKEMGTEMEIQRHVHKGNQTFATFPKDPQECCTGCAHMCMCIFACVMACAR